MLTERENALGQLVASRFRERRAERINNAMLKKGLHWREPPSFLKSLGEVVPFLKFTKDINNFRDLSNHNYRELLRSVGRLERNEHLFFKRFLSSKFYVCHATDMEDPLAFVDKDMVLFSRKKLIEEKIAFNLENTTSSDINMLANDDNVFFSLEIGEFPQKRISGGGSRFGETYYKALYSHSVFDFSSLYLFDQLTMNIPKCRLEYISNESAKMLRKRQYTRKSICFYGRKSLPALALSIIAVARQLPESEREYLLDSDTERDFNEIMRFLFRIEIRVPRIVGIKSEGFDFYP